MHKYKEDLLFSRGLIEKDETDIDLSAYGDVLYSVTTYELSVGYISKDHPYYKGKVPSTLVHKLKELLFMSEKNRYKRNHGIEYLNTEINLYHFGNRGWYHECPFCPDDQNIISISSEGLIDYIGDDIHTLGMKELGLPSVDGTKLYSFPDLIYHYITEHHYLPPQEFLDALEAFPMDRRFNLNEYALTLQDKLEKEIGVELFDEVYGKIYSEEDLKALDQQMRRKA